MADVTVSLDSSDIPVILDALKHRRRALDDRNESPDQSGATMVQELDLLINTFESVQA
ncbi:MAG TPA: hypothetical protein VGI56_14190 [Galbitalea sp.]